MKKLLALCILVFSVLGVGQAFAASQPDGKSGFASESACVSAVRSGKVVEYVPQVTRSPGSSYSRTTMRETGKARGACVTGLTTFIPGTWVYLGPEFEVGQLGENLVMWKCGNTITRISVIPFDQNVTQSQSIAIVQPQQCDGKCQAVNFCDGKNGTLVEVSENKWQCKLPEGAELELIMPGIKVSGRVEQSVFNGWASPPVLNVLSAPGQQISMGRPQAPIVSGQQCRCLQTGQMLQMGSLTCGVSGNSVTPPQTLPHGQNVGNVMLGANGACVVLTPQKSYMPAPGMIPDGRGGCKKG